jgi:hypothetical protein
MRLAKDDETGATDFVIRAKNDKKFVSPRIKIKLNRFYYFNTSLIQESRSLHM